MNSDMPRMSKEQVRAEADRVLSGEISWFEAEIDVIIPRAELNELQREIKALGLIVNTADGCQTDPCTEHDPHDPIHSTIVVWKD